MRGLVGHDALEVIEDFRLGLVVVVFALSIESEAFEQVGRRLHDKLRLDQRLDDPHARHREEVSA